MSSQSSSVSAIPFEIYQPLVQEDSIVESLIQGKIVYPAQFTHISLDPDELKSVDQALSCLMDGASRGSFEQAIREMEKSARKVDVLRERFTTLWDELSEADQKYAMLRRSIQQRNIRVTYHRDIARAVNTYMEIPILAKDKVKGPSALFAAGVLFDTLTATLKWQASIVGGVTYFLKTTARAYGDVAGKITLIKIPESSAPTTSDLHKIELTEKDYPSYSYIDKDWYKRCVSLINSKKDIEEGIGKAPIIRVLEQLNKYDLRAALLEKCIHIFRSRLETLNDKIIDCELQREKEEVSYARIGLDFMNRAGVLARNDFKSAIGWTKDETKPQEKEVQCVNADSPAASSDN